MTDQSSMGATRLGPEDRERSKALLSMMAETFEEESAALSDRYVDGLLATTTVWIVGVFVGDKPAGGLVAHALPMTRSESQELFIYDVAVHAEYQRQGIGRELVSYLGREAKARGITLMFVPADNDDVHALDFYRAIGGQASPVTFFTFGE